MPSSDLPTSRKFITTLLDCLRALPHASDDAANNATTTNPLVNAAEPVKKQLLALHVLFPNELLPALDLLDRRLVTRLRIRREHDSELGECAPSPQDVATFGSTTTISLHGHGPSIDDTVELLNDEYTARAYKASASNPPLTYTVGRKDSPEVEMITYLPRTTKEAMTGTEDGSDATTPRNDKVETDTIYYVRSAQPRSSRYSTSYDSTTSYEVRLKAWNCSCPAFAFSAFPSIHPEPLVPIYKPVEINQTAHAAGSEKTQQDQWSFGGIDSNEDMPPVCKHILACVLVERCAALFGAFVEEKEVSVEEAAGWAAGWGD